MGRPSQPETVTGSFHSWFPFWFECRFNQRLSSSVLNGWYS